MKIIDKSVQIAQSIFPDIYGQREGYRTFHFAFAWKKNNLLAIGQNRTDKPDGKALKFAKRFNTPLTIKYPYLHAEISAVSKLWGKTYIDSNIKMVVIRLNRFGELCNSKPCQSCSTVLNALNVTDVWWSTSNGSITNAKILC